MVITLYNGYITIAGILIENNIVPIQRHVFVTLIRKNDARRGKFDVMNVVENNRNRYFFQQR